MTVFRSVYKKRIVYKPSGIPNILSSQEVYMVETVEGIKDYKPYIDLIKKKYYIRDERKSEIVREGTATSPHKLKIKAKTELVKLGVLFEEEKRKPRKGEANEEKKL